ncbi:MAG: hypothetical protein ACREQY_12260, partial [Candidatus Binatia bacterium]
MAMVEERTSGPRDGLEGVGSRFGKMLKRLVEPPRVPEEFEAETRQLVLSRLRIVLVLALVLTPAFIPLDYFRVRAHFGAVVAMRLVSCVVFAILLPLTWRPFAVRHALALSATAIAVIAGYLAGVAPLTEGAHDPVYMQQSTALVFVIMGIGLLFPVDGRRLAMLGGIPLALQIVATLDFDPIDNLPMLTLS